MLHLWKCKQCNIRFKSVNQKYTLADYEPFFIPSLLSFYVGVPCEDLAKIILKDDEHIV